MINLLDKKKKWDYTSEEELTQIYQEQYNDVFSKILLLNSTQFMNVLEKQIITYLFIIKKQPILSLLSRISDYFIQKYYEDKEKVVQAYQIIKQTNINDIEFLDKSYCYLHCPYTGDAFHNCGNKFILCNNYIFCLQCKKVYNEDQAKMYCDYCGLEYYTTLREIENEELENYFPVCYENIHCLNVNEKEEKIKCKNCKEDLYVDISKYNNPNANPNINKNENTKNKKIENLYCLKCKQNFKIKDLDIKCQKCNKKYVSDIKIYNIFNNLKTDYLCLVHTLLKRKYAIPKNIKKRICKCELNSKKFKHSADKGNLLEGLRYGKKVIICDKCFKIFNYYNYNWNCPECGITINGNGINNLISKELSDSSSVSYKIEQEKNNLKHNSKYNTAAMGIKTKNIFPNNKGEIKNGKIIINNVNEKKSNSNNNEINNSSILRGSQKGNILSDRHSNAYNINNTFDKENKKNSNNIKDNNINKIMNNNNSNLNSNRNNFKDNKKLFNKININEDKQLINVNDKNNQTCNSLINSINSSIKLKNNFNDKNAINNNKTCIITFNGTNDSNNNSLNNKPNLTRGFTTSKLLSPDIKNEKIDYSLRYIGKENNKDINNKEINNLKNNKDRITSVENIKSENKLKRSYNYMNIHDSKNIISSKGNSKNRKKVKNNMDINEKNNDSNNNNNVNPINNSNHLNKVRKFSNKEQSNININNANNNIIKIDLGKNDSTLTPAKSSINIHSINNNLINNNKNININNKQYIKGKNEKQNIKSPPKMINNGNILNSKKQSDFVKQEIIKRNYSSDKNKQDKENNINLNSNIIKKSNYASNRNKNNPIEENLILNLNNNNIANNKNIIKNNDNIYSNIDDSKSNEENKIMNNLAIIKKNSSVNSNAAKNNYISKKKLNKVNINDNISEEKENDRNKKWGEKIMERSKGSPNHKRVDIVQTKNNNNNNKNVTKNIQSINVKLSHDLTNLNNNNILNKSQNGKDKENKILENKPVNRSINIEHNINNINEKSKNNSSKNNIYNNNNSSNNGINDSSNSNKNSNNQKNIINSIFKNSNNNSIGVIQQEDNEDENSVDYNVTKSINYSSKKSTKDKNENENIQHKNRLAENRYNNFNENNQIINENNIYIHDKKEEKKDKSKDKSKDKDKNKEENEDEDLPSKNIINSIYKKNNSENIEKNKLYANNNNNSKANINNLNNDTSKNISSEGYQFNCDNYNIVHLLGEGTFGKIYLVEDPADLKKYALKKIAVSDMEELGENKKEFELLMKLSQENPNLNVVKIFGIQVKKLDKFNLVMYVLMEAAQCDWENEIRNRNQYQAYYTEEELMKILTNLTTTLASLQRLGICHRDVKPQNILCFGKDNYKLSDFGEAKKKKKRKINGNCIYDFEGDTSKQTVRGTELYMSPILFKALHDCPEVDLEYNAYKSDVFSLGLCMLLSSTLGFQALYDIRELYDNNKIKKIVEKNLSSRYSKDYIKLINSMLQIKEKNRPDFIELENYIQNNYYNNNNHNNNNNNK